MINPRISAVWSTTKAIAQFSCTPCVQEVYTKAEVVHLTPGLLVLEMLGGNGAESNGTVNTTLEHVDLSWCHIGPEGAQHLAQALCVNTSVKTLVFLEQMAGQLNWSHTKAIALTKRMELWAQ